ncbi:OLC1v1030214C1 [Oldenlandia corymbosa var. corymbosa]|uniref:OLC1v1030214C1 n=1 Tax=Oldenlandia corymbosa var. corymbosa TaxID=529605 RepID=A0AAV1CIJ3_OLDCO|nr:OLC1v1030214C1 [Oldenlandia corymbosa var. corymbosa]
MFVLFLLLVSLQNQATDAEKKISWTLTRDSNFNFRAAHWADLYRILHNSLPSDIVLWGHFFLSFGVSNDKASVFVKCRVLESGNTVDIVGDLLIAADGCLSNIRKAFLPDFMLRYSGYCAWRGVLDFSSDEHDASIRDLKKAYPDLGKCLYFDLSSGSHSVFYELLHNRMNWIWYVNQPEPEVKGNSVTMKVSSDMIRRMHEEAEKVWSPELARIMKETREPFLNVIYDADPLKQLFWDNVVLIGDAAHPTTPHGLRSTNMSILDAAVLGKCLQKWGLENLHSALEEYQSIRLPVVSKQVLHSRRLGRIKQGLNLADRQPFDPTTADPEECEELQQKNMPFFTDVPSTLRDGQLFSARVTE